MTRNYSRPPAIHPHLVMILPVLRRLLCWRATRRVFKLRLARGLTIMDKTKLRLLLIAGAALLLAVAAGAGFWLHSRPPTGNGLLAQLSRGVQSVTGAAPASA